MTTRRSFLTTLLAIPVSSSFVGASCVPSNPITAAEMGISDAELFLSIVQSAADSFFISKPNAALQAKIDDAMQDTQQALRVCSNALAVAQSISDGNYQAALAAFQTALTALTSLIATIGIQVGPTPAGMKSMRRGDGVLIIAPPVILQHLRIKTSEAPFSRPILGELERWRHDPNYIPILPAGSDIDLYKIRRYYETTQPGWLEASGG